MMDLKLLENILAYYYDQARIYGGGAPGARAPPPSAAYQKQKQNKTDKTHRNEQKTCNMFAC